MKTRPWRYLVEFQHHNNTECPQPPPKTGRGLIKVWGTGDLPLCAECDKLSRLQNPGDPQTEGLHAAAPAFADADHQNDPR